MTTTITNCRWCGMSHGLRCPQVKAIEFEGDGVTVKRVEFITPADYLPMPHPTSPLPTYGEPWWKQQPFTSASNS